MFNQLIGQDKIKHYFSKALDSGKLQQCYLLHGPAGVGKTAAALDLAQIVTCHNTDLRPCGECVSCAKFATMDHPDVLLYFPVPGSIKPDEERSLRLSLAADPYAKLKVPKSGSLHIEMVRKLKQKLRLQSYQGQGRVVILLNCESLTSDAGNALLKILEEPPEDVTFLLTTTIIDNVPATIRSRCQLMYMSYLPSECITEALLKRLNIEANKAVTYAQFSGGSFSRAFELTQEGYTVIKDACSNILETCLTKNQVEIIEFTDLFMKQYDGAAVKSILELMIAVLKQIYENAYASHNDTEDHVPFITVPSVYKTLAPVKTENAIRAIEKSVDLMNKNVYIYTILLTLFFKLNSVHNHE